MTKINKKLFIHPFENWKSEDGRKVFDVILGIGNIIEKEERLLCVEYPAYNTTKNIIKYDDWGRICLGNSTCVINRTLFYYDDFIKNRNKIERKFFKETSEQNKITIIYEENKGTLVCPFCHARGKSTEFTIYNSNIKKRSKK